MSPCADDRERAKRSRSLIRLHHLRKKLGSAVIKNVRGVGYRVTED